MPTPEEINADMLAFWNGQGGQTWVARQATTDIALSEASAALLVLAKAMPGEAVLDVGCGSGASTLEIARALGADGRVIAMDISGPLLAEGASRAKAAGISNIAWQQADPATSELQPYDLLASKFGVMFFGDPQAAFSNMRRFAKPGARLAFVCWRQASENPWIKVVMEAAAKHLPPRPPVPPRAPGMFAFAERDYIAEVLTVAGWRQLRIEACDIQLDIAAGKGLEEAVAQSTGIGAVNSWLRGQSAEVISAATQEIRSALSPFAKGPNVRLPGAIWLVAARAG